MDKIGIRTIVVNFDDEQLPYLSLVQGDSKTRGFDIVICDSDGKEIPPSDDYIVELVASGSNAPDTPYANRHTIKDGKYRVMIPTEALSESGFVFLQLVFYQKSTGAVIHTIEQKCPVYRSRGQEVVESNNLYVDITALRLALEDEATRKSNEIKRETNEATRKLQETARKSAEDKRNHDEAIRKDNELIRKANETTRKSDETARQSAEDKRVIAEKEREVNEAQRQKNKLVAGANVQIDGATNTISATDTITTINGKTGAISKADITALGIPSQDTNTTYSEITTAEIDTGTASTLRTITGRRVKYILDKIQGWIGNLTKADVGLNNVDNVKQATKVEFDSHDTNTTRHITNTERTNWNTKETTTGSQDKANQAEQNAKSYVDGKVLDNETQILTLDKEVSSVSLWDKTLAPGGKKPIIKEEQYAFYGEVSSEELISGDELALQVRLTSGNSVNSDAGWLKFLYKGKILFVAKKKLRINLSWDNINNREAVYGEKIIIIENLSYKVRLLRGVGEDVQPVPYIHQENAAGAACYYSEWNNLFCPISEEAPSLWQYPDNVQEPISKLRKTYTNIELDMSSGSSWCQEACGAGHSYRGGKGVSHAASASSTKKTEGWRPVLELVE